VKHLYDKHKTTELSFYKNSEFLDKIFNIDLENGSCKLCTEVIPYKKRGLYILLNHYKMFHSVDDNESIFYMAVKVKNGREILDKFKLTDKKATCVLETCELEINIEDLNEFTADRLKQLAEHFFSHYRYDNNFFIFDKTIENRFCFTCFFF